MQVIKGKFAYTMTRGRISRNRHDEHSQLIKLDRKKNAPHRRHVRVNTVALAWSHYSCLDDLQNITRLCLFRRRRVAEGGFFPAGTGLPGVRSPLADLQGAQPSLRSAWQLVGQNVDTADLRRLGE